MTARDIKTDDIVDSLERCFISPNVADSNMEPANLVDVVQRLAAKTGLIADAITPDAVPGVDAAGGHVRSLTEAVMGMTAGLVRIADAVGELAAAVRERDAS